MELNRNYMFEGALDFEILQNVSKKPAKISEIAII